MNNNELSNLSYTNKDFNSIYSELLEYVKKLSSKWDPSESNESDPGLILLKLAAIIGDKDSYNIDKNVLELMPASVSQLPAARQLFDQCGYTMRYYQSATGVVNLTIRKELLDSNIDYSYTLPKFTMFTDSSSSIVYTSTQSMSMQRGTEYTVPVIEGTVVNYTVNNDPLITMQNIDSNNRLYFSETNIAENGIFITNVDDSKEEVEWIRVDNLQTQPKGEHRYKFGITLDTESCYIEFPEDVELLIGEGLNIHYILTSGSKGNVSAGKLNKFYVDTSFEVEVEGKTQYVTSDKDSVTIKNSLPIVNGLDPETIDEAYVSYEKVKGTFDTLVSLKDYNDYLVTSETASNGFVCDRTNDIQHSYKVLTTSENTTYIKTHVEDSDDVVYVKDLGGAYVAQAASPSMNPFDLCVYALEYVPSATTDTQFNKSYQLIDISRNHRIGKSIFNNTLDDIKSLQHEFKSFDPEKILMIKNKYPIRASIIPRYPLSVTEKYQVLYNVETALYKALCSNKMTFGKDVDLVKLQETIIGADERIKTLVDFMSTEYETYVVYKTPQNEFKEMRVDFASDNAGFVQIPMTASKYNSVTNKDIFYKKQDGQFELAIDSSGGTAELKHVYDSSKTYYEFNSDLEALWDKFRVEIFTKNVLSSVTPLYTSDNEHIFKVTYASLEEYNPVLTLSTNVDIPFTTVDSTLQTEALKPNENVILTAPNLITENNFSTYVKVLYFFGNNAPECIESGAKYELSEDDMILFFWKPSDSGNYYNVLKYDGTENSLAKFVSPSEFSLNKTQDLTSSKITDINSESIRTYFKDTFSAGVIQSTNNLSSSTALCKYDGKEVKAITDFVDKVLISSDKQQVLTGTQIINMMNINSIHVNNNDNGCSNIYWILNKVVDGTSTLFATGVKEYTLQSGEYLLYTNDDKSMLYVLGQGTLLQRTSTEDGWSIEDPINYEELVYSGISLLDGKWYSLPRIEKQKYDEDIKRAGLWATEQQQILIGPNNKITLSKLSGSTTQNPDKLTSKEWTNLSDFNIQYQSTETGSTTIHVDNIYSQKDGWKCKTLLNINISKTKAQEFVDNQSVTIKTEDKTTIIYGPTIDKIPTIDDPSTTVVLSEKFYLTSTQPIVSLGGQDIDVYHMYNKDVGILKHTLNQQDEYTDVYDASSFVFIQIPAKEDPANSTFEHTLNFKLLCGEYLLQIHSSSSEITKDVQGADRINESDTFRIRIPDTTGDVQITLSGTKTDMPITITIPPLFRYKKDLLELIDSRHGNPLSAPSFESKVIERIKDLDKEKAFNYTNVPATPITNPLVSTEFFKKQHFYNAFTIPQWNTEVENNVIVKDVVR